MKEIHFGFKQSKAHPTNIRLRLKKEEEVNTTDEALKVEKITDVPTFEVIER